MGSSGDEGMASMVDVERREAVRLYVMKTIYDESDGIESNLLSGLTLRDQPRFSDQEIMNACLFLESEGLIKCIRSLSNDLMSTTVGITHRGVNEMERAERTPTERTRYFPPVNIVVVH